MSRHCRHGSTRVLGKSEPQVQMFDVRRAGIPSALSNGFLRHRLAYRLLSVCLTLFAALVLVATPAYANVTISGQAWNDVDQDGIFDAGETGANGVTILVDTNGDTIPEHTTTTSGGGFYSFDIPEAPSFTYRVRQQVPANRNATTTETKVFVIGPGDSATDVNFGSYLVVQISGMTWDDLDGDGIQEGGEPGLDGVTVTLDLNNDGVPEHTTSTSGGGLYSFRVAPGTSGS